jgi:threonine aldolase
VHNTTTKMIDLRSDTVTRPSRAMLETALTAATGDDVLGEDPTVRALEERVADLLGKPYGLFFPTCTMANLCALTAHCDRREDMEFLVGSRSHICLYECGNVSSAAGIHSRQVEENETTAEFDLSELAGLVRNDVDDDHYCRMNVLCLENTHNMLGGVPLRSSYVRAVGDFCRHHNMKLHIDGARLANAVVATADRASTVASSSFVEICQPVHSVSLCLSKGLGAPLGAVLVGDNAEFRRLAKRARKKYGGGMRQAGVVAAMGLYALEHNLHRLTVDHQRATRLADRLRGTFPLLRDQQSEPSSLSPPSTNMVYFTLPDDAKKNLTDDAFLERLRRDFGVLLYGGFGPRRNAFRAVTHLDVDDDDIETAATALIRCLE